MPFFRFGNSISCSTPTYDLSAVCSLQCRIAPRLFLSLSLSLSSTSESDQQFSSPATCPSVAGSFARPSPTVRFLVPPVSPLQYSRVGGWLMTVLQDPCQQFVLRKSAGLVLFRSLTVPLLAPSLLAAVVSPCSALFAWSLWLFFVSYGASWASMSIDNLLSIFIKIKRLSMFVANFILLRMQHLPTNGTSVAFPLGRNMRALGVAN